MEYIDTQTDSIIFNSLQKLNASTNLTFLSPGSKARLLVEVLGEEIGLQAEQFDENIGKSFIRNASGKLLDYLGEIYGVTRLKEEKAVVFEEEENFQLFTFDPSFGDINNGQDIVIKAGAINIYNTEDPSSQIVYTNIDDIVLDRNSNSQFFAAEARFSGAKQNVGSATLVFHDFTGYSDSLSQSLLVTNNQSITYGRNQESDDNFRFRIQREKLSAEAGNQSSIRLQALLVPGVADIIRVPYRRGVGTTDWLIKSVTPLVSAGLINAVQEAISLKESSGTSNLAQSPVIVGIELFFSLTYKRSLEDSEKERIKAEVRKQIANHINNLDIGEPLILDQVVRIVLNSSDEIESMGARGSSENFSNIFMYKRSGYSNSITRKTLISDYRTKQTERVILEPRIEAPIVIVDNN